MFSMEQNQYSLWSKIYCDKQKDLFLKVFENLFVKIEKIGKKAMLKIYIKHVIIRIN